MDKVSEDAASAAKPSEVSRPPTGGAAGAVVLALIAALAIAAAVYFWRGQQAASVALASARAQAARAEQKFEAGKRAIEAIVADLADGLAKPKGIEARDIPAILAQVETAVDTMTAQAGNDPEAQRSQGGMHVQLSSAYLALGDVNLAIDDARKGVEIFRALAAAQPNNNDVQSDVGLSLEKLGEALRAGGDSRGALAADRESLEIARALAARDPGNRQFCTDVVLALWRLASVGDDPRARLTEALKILNNLKLAAMLTPAQERWIDQITNELANL
jgi:tetratricopeptide (TPR) repeat protein